MAAEEEEMVLGEKEYSVYWEGDKNIIDQPHECLLKYQDKLLGDGKPLKIFIPMCGRAFDMKFFAELGHEVVGVEFAKIAITQFFKSFNISYDTQPMVEPEGVLYTSTEKNLNIRIYCCDFFQFGPHLEKDFQAVWDSGSLYSLPKSQTSDYVTVVKSVLAPSCHGLVVFDVPNMGVTVTPEELRTLYGEGFGTTGLGYHKRETTVYEEFDVDGFNVIHLCRLA